MREHRHLPFEQRGIHALPATGEMTHLQRHQHADRGKHASTDISHRHAHLDRPAARLTGDAHAPGIGLHEQIVGRLRGERADGTEAADGTVDEPRIDLREAFIIEPGPVECAQPVVADHDICLLAQTARDRCTVR